MTPVIRLRSRLFSASVGLISLAATAFVATTCSRPAENKSIPTASALEPAPAKLTVVEPVYEGALAKGWQDWGWAPRDVGNGPARINMENWGGWILAYPGTAFLGPFGALVFRLRAPADFGEFLEIHLASDSKSVYPNVIVKTEHKRAGEEGFEQIIVPMRALNPDNIPFDRVIFRAYKKVGGTRVEIDRIGFTAASAADLPRTEAPRDIVLTVDCGAAPQPISPSIYGISYDAAGDAKAPHLRDINPGARRWGGNPSSRYNWELGNAWNTASDWYFQNVNYAGRPGAIYEEFLTSNIALGAASALTIPTIGYVARDTTSYSFPVSQFGPQRATDPYKPDAGDGYTKDGKPIPPGNPARTSVAAPPEMIKRWVQAIRAEDAKRGVRGVQMYILDNEPMLWHETHRDVHPEPVSYDELLDRTLRYGKAVREADPGATIAGPALWGWAAYLYSAKDGKAGYHLKPDRLAHGDVPLLPWWLSKLKEHESRTGTRIIDVVDVHFYPQAEGVGGEKGGFDHKTAAKRIRSTRALWDPGYVDESWIKESVELIPRLKRWINENNPGLGIAIGEYNFGAEGHISGGLAQAEALGRFGQGGVHAAFYWGIPPQGSPVYWAMRAFRNFDGSGGRFLDLSLPTRAPDGMSIFASRDAGGTRLVAVILNFSPTTPVRPKLTARECGKILSKRVFQYTGGAAGLAQVKEGSGENAVAEKPLPPYSITVLEATLEKKP